MNPSLRDRWARLWIELGLENSELNEGRVFADLVKRYSEPQRVYHTLAHLEHCMTELDEVRHLALHAPALELALWLHDIIEVLGRHDNVKKSAEFASALAEVIGLGDEYAFVVHNLVMATNHDESASTEDARLLVDIDLSILGQPEERFDLYERQIRAEYHAVPTDKFRAGRAEILTGFLKRPLIYKTPYFQDKYEVQARRNLARSLAALAA